MYEGFIWTEIFCYVIMINVFLYYNMICYKIQNNTDRRHHFFFSLHLKLKLLPPKQQTIFETFPFAKYNIVFWARFWDIFDSNNIMIKNFLLYIGIYCFENILIFMIWFFECSFSRSKMFLNSKIYFQKINLNVFLFLSGNKKK